MSDSSFQTEPEVLDASAAPDAVDAPPAEVESPVDLPAPEAPPKRKRPRKKKEPVPETVEAVDAAPAPDATPEVTEPRTEAANGAVEVEEIKAVGEPAAIVEEVYPVPRSLKAELLLELLIRGEVGRALVFVRTRQRVNRLAEWLGKHGIACERSHGNRSSRQRTAALASLESGKVRLMVVTEIPQSTAPDVPLWLVFLDPPTSPEDYRAWREYLVGRATGARIFAAPREENQVRSLEKALELELPRLSLEGFDYQSESSDPLDDRKEEGKAQFPRKAKGKGKAKGNRGKKSKGRSRNQGSGTQAGWDGAGEGGARGSEDDEEARIRARAEALQAAAVAARMNPSRMGIMDYRAPRPGKAGKAGKAGKGEGERRRGGSRKRSRRSNQG